MQLHIYKALKIRVIFHIYLNFFSQTKWKLLTVDPQERSNWRSGVRSAMRAASQLPGRGPTDVDDAPAPAC